MEPLILKAMKRQKDWTYLTAVTCGIKVPCERLIFGDQTLRLEQGDSSHYIPTWEINSIVYSPSRSHLPYRFLFTSMGSKIGKFAFAVYASPENVLAIPIRDMGSVARLPHKHPEKSIKRVLVELDVSAKDLLSKLPYSAQSS